jgi:predicted TIM-barrel fold metal-dependent hydrolase
MPAHTTRAGLSLGEYLPRPALSVAEHPIEKARWVAVDAHGHLGKWLSDAGSWVVGDLPRLLAVMDAARVRAIVNLDGRWGAELEENLTRYDRRYPGRFVTFCHVDWAETAAPGFGGRLAQSLRRSVATGARGLKVWKDLGLNLVDDRGRLLLPDDRRLGPLWDAAGEAGVPVVIHIADPVAFFDPVDGHNERFEELTRYPDWSCSHLGRSHYHRLIEALEDLVGAHPGTTFVGAHIAGAAEDLDLVERLLDAHANLCIDIAARVAELGRQPRRARELMLRHADRVLFGIDGCPPDMREYAIAFRFLETDDEHFAYSPDEPPPQGRWRISGLGLPDDVLKKVYADNARRVIAGLSS